MKTPQQETNEAIADISRAHRAEELLNNPLYLEAIEAMSLAMQKTFEDTSLNQEHERHELWQRMQLMKQFKGKFESIVKQGVNAQKTLTLLEKGKQLFNRI